MNRKRRKAAGIFLSLTVLSIAMAGCGKSENQAKGAVSADSRTENPHSAIGAAKEAGDGDTGGGDEKKSGIAGESAQDAEVDFETLKKENQDIFAWLYVPGTDIDYPVLQSTQADDYYMTHDAYGRENGEGALYTELANLTDMCDFNTVIHGKAPQDGKEGLFTGLYQFGNPDFFEQHKDAYLYLEGNLLTYTIFAAYERENNSLIRSYDFTYGSGCEQFLADLYGTREMGKNLREGWEGLTPYNFLITLTAENAADPDRQFVVVAALVGDAAGKIDRAVEW